MAIREPMTINAWPDLRKEQAKVAKNLNLSWGKVGELFGGHGFGFLFFVTNATQQVTKRNIILFGTFLGATDAFSDTSIVYYSSKRYMCNQHF